MIRIGVVLLAISSLLVMVGAFAKIMHHDAADIILGIAMITNVVSWCLLAYGLIKRRPEGG